MTSPETAAKGQLVQLNEARTRLAKVASVDEAKKIRDQAEALRHYAQQQKMGLEAQNSAAEIKIRAERRAGELLAQIERTSGPTTKGKTKTKATRQPGGLKAPTSTASAPVASFQDTIKTAGISETTARRFQEIASVPEPVFEKFVQVAKEGEQELTSAATVRFARSARENPEADASKAARESIEYQWEVQIGKLDRIAEFFLENAAKATKAQRTDLAMALDRAIKTLRRALKEIA